VTTHIDYSNIEIVLKYELYPKIIHIILIVFILYCLIYRLFSKDGMYLFFKIDLTDFDHIISHSAFFLAFESLILFNFVTKKYPYIIATINDDIIAKYFI
jgi:hypothetical protein